MAFLHKAVLRAVRRTQEGRRALDEAAVVLLGELRNNGQIWGEPLVVWSGDELHVVVKAPCRDSLSRRHQSGRVRGAVERLREECAGPLVWRSAGGADDVEICSGEWARCPGFYLFTHALDDTSPVVAGDHGKAVPLYLLPVGDGVRAGLVSWMEAYKHHDNLWLDSGALERAAYGQLAGIESELSRRGRALAKELEAGLGKPVYYYLHRYEALPEGEGERRCPGCGGAWAREGDATTRGLGWFDFLCEGCRVVSHRGVDVRDDS